MLQSVRRYLFDDWRRKCLIWICLMNGPPRCLIQSGKS